jgi:hypothetical protein
VVVVVLLAMVLAVKEYFEAVRRELTAESERRRATLARAHDLAERIASRSLAEITDPEASPDSVLLFGSKQRLAQMVQAVYDLFEGAYGGAGASAISFEATFMALSYKDGYITIPAHANRDARAPVSLQHREQQPDLYDKSVSAVVLQQTPASVQIIEDTETDPRYSSLYEGQKKRIKSTVVYPVRDGQNRALGTLVVHCDKRGFFLQSDESYWTSLLEVFAKRLAYEKAKMDRLSALMRAGLQEVNVRLPPPPF